MTRRTRQCYVFDMGRADRITILLSVAALCVTIVGTSCSTNARIGDLNARIDDLRVEVTAQIDGVNARMDDLRAEVTAQIGAVNARIDDLGATLNARIDDLGATLNARIDGLDRDMRDLRAIVIDAVRVAPPRRGLNAPAELERAAPIPPAPPGPNRRIDLPPDQESAP